MSDAVAPDAATIDARIQEGVRAFEAKDFARAEQLFRALLEVAPGELRAVHSIGVVLSQSGRRGEARAFLEPYVEKGALLESALLLGELYEEVNEPAKAMLCYKLVLKHVPTQYQAAMRLAAIKDRMGDKPGARECYRRALEGSPNDVQAAIKYTNANWANDPEGGVAIMERLLAAVGDDLVARARVLETLIPQKEWWERMRRGLMPYHATHVDELFYKYAADYVKDYEATNTKMLVGKHAANANHALGYARFVQGDRIGAEPLLRSGPGEPLRGNILDAIRFKPEFYDELRRQQINDLTAGLPDLLALTPLVPDARGVVYLSCNFSYYRAFAQPMIVSLKDVAPHAAVHLHIMDATVEEGKAAVAFCEKLAPLRISISLERPGFANPPDQDGRNYYHAIRFIRYYQHLLAYECPLWMMDVDALFHRDPAEMFAVMADKDAAMRIRPARIEPWNQFNACIVGASMNPASLEYFHLVAAYLAHFYKEKQLRWGIDQLAMYGVYADMQDRGRAPTLALLGEREVDYDYRDDGFVWCNSGAAKFRHLARISDPKSMPMADFEGNRFVEVFEQYWKKTEAIVHGRAASG